METNEFNIREAETSDAAGILEIYAPFVSNSSVTFEYTAPSVEEFSIRIETIKRIYPFFVCEFKNKIVGYAYASKFRERDAYQWDIETSVYIDELFQKKGLAGLLYDVLLEECRNLGFYNAYAVITLPNPKSVGFHTKQGFTQIGIFEDTGFKNGHWHSVLFMGKKLLPNNGTPHEIRRLS